MTLRVRLLIASFLLVVVPLTILAYALRSGMTQRLTQEYTRRAETLLEVLEGDLAARGEAIGTGLKALSGRIAADNRFRLAAVEDQPRERAYLIDYAGHAMGLQGLDFLQIQDASGKILSSGHFRADYGRDDLRLKRFLASVPGSTGLAAVRRPAGPFLVLARVDSLNLGLRRFYVLAGKEVGREFLIGLTREPNLAVSLVLPHRVLSSNPNLETVFTRGADSTAAPALPEHAFFSTTIDRPFLPAGTGSAPGAARIVVSYPRAPLKRILLNLDAWLISVLATVALGTLVLAFWFSDRISRPMRDLAEKTAGIDLERLDNRFWTTRSDEVGTLSRFLDAMTGRLRTDAQVLREAERRGAVGEIARQVNHDVKNGLMPLRNVFRHLAEVAARDPMELPAVFRQRYRILESSMAYLEELAANYARLSPGRARAPVDLAELARRVVSAMEGGAGVSIGLEVAQEPAVASADPVGVRRVFENLIQNAVESARPVEGSVSVRIEPGSDGYVRLIVADSGPGIPPEHRDHILDDFYTTKETGSGLGLSIVRRLVADFAGRMAIESEPGSGARFVVDLPADVPDDLPARVVDPGPPSGRGE
jgi:signal transduction histidine kinase